MLQSGDRLWRERSSGAHPDRGRRFARPKRAPVGTGDYQGRSGRGAWAVNDTHTARSTKPRALLTSLTGEWAVGEEPPGDGCWPKHGVGTHGTQAPFWSVPFVAILGADLILPASLRYN